MTPVLKLAFVCFAVFFFVVFFFPEIIFVSLRSHSLNLIYLVLL